MTQKVFHKLGEKMKKVKTWQKATRTLGKGLNTAGDITMVVGTATGQPEVVAAGGAMKEAGAVSNKTSKILKNAR